ncbi:U-box domain-containing protein 33-like isoform X2 [Lotus japonicus]|uniref:U-box domain-containing protein 33-like isoform X2 n=1 Tax=Lotus japonicus TaxID=34305 RepID=UPI0025841DDC|nr:U-box domain-containing protein 33-like isoform X2 [Lotus japonicus]XP_057435650.1 U-box domain-containing protein 33-like isoform X2 [Lotus japonicus]
MAVVCPVPATTQRSGSVSSVGEIVGEIAEEPNPTMVDEPIYVAVSKDIKESKLNLIWAIQNSGGKRICILFVHVPATMIPLMGAKFPASSLKDQEVRAYREIERQNMHKTLDEYLRICQRMGVRAEKLHIEMDSIERGILELVSQYGIRKLVMGAACDKHYSRRMVDLRSKKAIYVCERAPASCHVQFICKGHLIHTRDRSLDQRNAEAASLLVQQVPNLVRSLRSQSLGQNLQASSHNAAQELYRRARSTNDIAVSSPDDTEGFSTPRNRVGTEVSSDESERPSRRSPSGFSTCSDGAIEAALTPNLINEISENVIDLTLSHLIKEDLRHSSPPSVLDGGMNDTLYDQLEQSMAEAENATRHAYQETFRRGRAEKDAIEAIRRAKAAESLYAEELNLRKMAEEELETEKEELENLKSQADKVKEELRLAQDQKSSLESQLASSELMVKELEQKIISAVDLLQNYKNEREELEVQRDSLLREAEELRKKQGEASSSHVSQLFSEFSFSEIEEAAGNFNPSLKIGEGGYGSIFKGVLRHTEVAIKMLHPNSMQGPLEFQQEVDVLSKLRHPNLITLIGACPESWGLVYEYLPNGSLEDRLVCKDNTPPLSWQTRIRIAAELCSALIFLHSCKPHSIVHGDLKPSNILLDANLVSKLSDFGICRILSNRSSSDNATQLWRTDPKGTFVYMDPEFLASGELTPKSDVYSFGIILMRLLTGRQALGISKEVKYAVDTGKLKSLLDPLAGDWPFVQAEQLAHLALRCCEMSRKSRPDLCSDVWRILDAMRASSGGTNSFGLSSEGLHQPPSYFICPIFQEVMRDPHVAADGFTYEAEAIRGWLDSGHDTSPMTNSKLAHQNLVPNRALRSAIQDWLQSQ